MLGNLSPINIYKQRSLLRTRASDPASLFLCVQMPTELTAIDLVALLVDQILELIHVDLRLKTVSLVLEIVQYLKGNLVGDQLHGLCGDIAHVERHLDHVIQIVGDVGGTLDDEPFHLEEVCRDQYWDHVVDGDLGFLGPDVLHQPFEDVDVTLDADVDVFG